ncbi:MAG: hypothetical protein IIY52_01920 [Solobacterium sp.]|nr:hypothetical protein [Solobacterium sp.]
MNRQIYRALHMNKQRLLKKIFSYEELYAVGIRRRKGNSTLLDDTVSPFTIIPSSDDHWYADPLIYEFDGRTYLFVEDYDRHAKKGVISAAEISEDSTPRFCTVIEEPYHLSFPMIFRWKDELWMCPESSDNMSLNLYRCVSIPDQWEKVCELRTGMPLVDTVMLETSDDSVKLLSSTFNPDNGLEVRYVQCTVRNDHDSFSLDIEDNHAPYNLIERNAGNLFTVDGSGYLPTQQSTYIDYGVYLNIVPVQEKGQAVHLGPNDLSCEGISSKYDRVGIHTYSLTDQYEAMDLRYLKFMPDKYFNKTKRS